MGGEAGNGVAIKMKGAGLGAKKCEGGSLRGLNRWSQERWGEEVARTVDLSAKSCGISGMLSTSSRAMMRHGLSKSNLNEVMPIIKSLFSHLRLR